MRKKKSKVDWHKVGRKSKTKGNSYERLIAKIFSEYFNEEFIRTPSSGGMDLKGDICFKEFYKKRMPVLIDTKDQKTLLGARMKQELLKARQDADYSKVGDRYFLVVHEPGTSNHFAMLPLDFLHELLKKSSIF